LDEKVGEKKKKRKGEKRIKFPATTSPLERRRSPDLPLLEEKKEKVLDLRNISCCGERGGRRVRRTLLPLSTPLRVSRGRVWEGNGSGKKRKPHRTLVRNRREPAEETGGGGGGERIKLFFQGEEGGVPVLLRIIRKN